MKQRLPGLRDGVLVAHETANCEHLGIRLVAAGPAEAGFRARGLHGHRRAPGGIRGPTPAGGHCAGERNLTWSPAIENPIYHCTAETGHACRELDRSVARNVRCEVTGWSSVGVQRRLIGHQLPSLPQSTAANQAIFLACVTASKMERLVAPSGTCWESRRKPERPRGGRPSG